MTVEPPSPSSGWAVPAVPLRATAKRYAARRAWALTGSIVLAVLCAMLAMAVGGGDTGKGSTFPPALQVIATVGVFPMIGVSVMLVWRHRFPLLISIIATALTLVLPTTPLPALISLAAVTAIRRGWLMWVMVAATYLATVSSFVWDLTSRMSYLGSFADYPAAGTPARMALFWVAPLIAALVVAPFAAFGIARRIRRERDAAQQGNVAGSRNIAVLHQEVSLERARQELARELHDTLAARLSTLSLHAGALELTVNPDNEQAVAAARTVRESAQTSLDDLRHVVNVLRNPTAASVEAGTGLNNLGQLVNASLREGTDVRAQVLIGDPASCDPVVAHACYRLVQESISNVRRHAPAATLYVDVRGSPETGLTMSAVNWLVPGAPSASDGGGHGLTGMSERAALVGGTFQAGVTPEGSFAVVAWLPWKPQSLN